MYLHFIMIISCLVHYQKLYQLWGDREGGKEKNQTLLSLIIITVIKIPDLLLWAKYFK